MSNLSITRADSNDLELVLDMIRAYYAFDDIAFERERVFQGLSELISDRTLGDAWVIRRAGDAIGYFLLTYGFDLELGGRQATVTELFIREDARRTGAGRAAIEHVEARLRAIGIRAYELQVEHDNVSARAFYEQMGFTSHDRIPLSKTLSAAPSARSGESSEE